VQFFRRFLLSQVAILSTSIIEVGPRPWPLAQGRLPYNPIDFRTI
jgi:hypothetical protein